MTFIETEQYIEKVSVTWTKENLPSNWSCMATHKNGVYNFTYGLGNDVDEHYQLQLHASVVCETDWSYCPARVNTKVKYATTDLDWATEKWWGEEKYKENHFKPKIIEQLESSFKELLKIERNNLWILHKDSESKFIKCLANQYLTKQLNLKRDS